MASSSVILFSVFEIIQPFHFLTKRNAMFLFKLKKSNLNLFNLAVVRCCPRFHDKVAGKPTISMVGGIATSPLVWLNIIFNSNGANVGLFLVKNKNIFKKIVNLTIFFKAKYYLYM